MSLDEPRTPRATYSSAKNNAYGAGTNKQRSNLSFSGEGRISPWLPIGIGAVTVLILARALAGGDNRTTSQRLFARANRGWNDWWPDARDTAESYGSRARSWMPDSGSAREWLYDAIPTRRSLSDLFARGSDWLPDAKTSKRQLLSSFDYSNPPRWLKNVDLSSGSKRQRFLKDLRRYGSRKSDNFLSSMGWR